MYARASLIDLFHNPDAISQHAGLIPVTKVQEKRYWLMLVDREGIFSNFFVSSREGYSNLYEGVVEKLQESSQLLAHSIHRSIQRYPERVVIWKRRTFGENQSIVDSFLLFVPIPPLSRIAHEHQGYDGSRLEWYIPQILLREFSIERYHYSVEAFFHFFRFYRK